VDPDLTITQSVGVGDYRLQKVLGRGGMGIVWKAIDSHGRTVALKLLHGPIESDEMKRRFEREAKVAIKHPNIVEVLEVGTTEDGAPYIAFEYLEGLTVSAWLGRESPTIAQIVQVGIQACRALSAAHAQGIVHRDVKPSNLFRCTDGTIKLLDFGVALFSEEQTRLTAFGAVVGTPAYFSPEQARAEDDVDERTDVWSLGAVLYKALTGQSPYQRHTSIATMVAAAAEAPPPIQTTAPTVPSALAAIVERALTPAREERWQTADALGEALAAIDLSSPELGTAPMPSRAATSAEQRVVALLLAEGVSDLDAFKAAVEQRAGSVVFLSVGQLAAVFGDRAWEGDEVIRAASAALEIRPLAAHVALASGRGTLGPSGISGAVLLTAERACAAALPGIAVDPESARALGPSFEVRRVRDDLFEISPHEDRPSIVTVDRTTDEVLAPLFGREVEVAQMEQAWARACDEHRAVAVLVTGPPGIGKTRLRREMERRLVGSDELVTILSGRAEPTRRDQALSLLASVLETKARRDWAPGGTGTGTPTDERRRAAMRLAAEAIGDPAAARQCGLFLGELLGIPMPDDVTLAAARRDPQLMADRLRLALRDFIGGWAARGPVALIVEDLQWADEASVELLDDVLDWFDGESVLVLATARGEIRDAYPELFAGRELVRIEPRGLGSTDGAALARATAGRPLPDELVQAVVERSGGNPLFVEQLVLALRDAGLADADVAELPLPLSVEAAVQARLDALSPAEKELCKRAAVLGRPFGVDAIRALGLANAPALLGALLRRDILSVRARAPGRSGREHQFKSPLVAEVAYRMVSDELRVDLHRRAAAHLASLPEPVAEEIATHHERGGEPERAAGWWAEAALAATRRGDGAAVLRCSERALTLGVPEAGRSALHLARAEALRFLGRRADELVEYDAALAVAATDGDRARALTERAFVLSRTGKVALALEVAEQAVVAARAAADDDVLLFARGRQAAALTYAGRFAEAAEALAEVGRLAEGAPPLLRAFAAEWQAELATATGDLAARCEAYRLAAERFAEAGDLRRRARAQVNLADSENRFGMFAQAEAALRVAVDDCRRVGKPEGYALANLGYALVMQGRMDEALRALEAAQRLATTGKDPRLAAAVDVYRARALSGREPPARVAELAEGAAGRAEAAGVPAVAAGALAFASRSKLAAGDVAAALSLARRAMERRDALGGLEEDEAEVFLALAEALAATGDVTEEAAVRARGRERLAAIANGIADPERRARFLAATPAQRALCGTA